MQEALPSHFKHKLSVEVFINICFSQKKAPDTEDQNNG